MVLRAAGRPLELAEMPDPVPGEGEVLVKVAACGVCRTDLHIVDGELPTHRRAVVPGHEIVGEVVEAGPGASRFGPGQRIGVPWLGRACGVCGYCRGGHENLCDAPAFTGYDRDGGYAEYAVADERFCLALPPQLPDVHAAPLLCAGLIGFRTWRLAGGLQARRIGLWGFGAAAHIVCQLAVAQGQEVFAFTRPGDETAPALLDAAMIFAPAGALVPAALGAVRKGGVVVCGGIHMSDIPSFSYERLWGERTLRSVANLTRADGEEFFAMLARVPVHTHVQTYPLERANAALQALRHGQVSGAAVLLP